MDPDGRSERLSRLSTFWALLQQAHAGPADATTAARNQLLQRYWGAVYHYLLGALRDEDAAEEQCQEFAVRFLRGAFRGAHPERGRFRDYLKRALGNLVNDYHRQRKRQPGPLPPDRPAPAPADPEPLFTESWRQALINLAWEALARENPTYHAVLLSYAERPELTSAQRAEELSAKLGKPVSAGNVRGIKLRAGARFADLLLREMEDSLEGPSEEALLQELRGLRLLELCEPGLKRRGRSAGPR